MRSSILQGILAIEGCVVEISARGEARPGPAHGKAAWDILLAALPVFAHREHPALLGEAYKKDSSACPKAVPRARSVRWSVVRRFCLGLSVGGILRPAGWGVLKVLLAAVGCGVEEAIGVGERFGAAGVSRLAVEDGVLQAEEDA
jgi:hypothetical protein